MAAFRRGEIAQAEQYYRAALKIDPKNPGALVGMASLLLHDFQVQGWRAI